MNPLPGDSAVRTAQHFEGAEGARAALAAHRTAGGAPTPPAPAPAPAPGSPAPGWGEPVQQVPPGQAPAGLPPGDLSEAVIDLADMLNMMVIRGMCIIKKVKPTTELERLMRLSREERSQLKLVAAGAAPFLYELLKNNQKIAAGLFFGCFTIMLSERLKVVKEEEKKQREEREKEKGKKKEKAAPVKRKRRVA